MQVNAESKTLKLMLTMYCRAHHETQGELCEDCRQLFDYAGVRLERCPLGEKRSTCGQCPIHCYRSDMKKKITAVMRYAGPRMARRHPWLAFKHMLRGWLKGRL